jgi:hypothetical protein
MKIAHFSLMNACREDNADAITTRSLIVWMLFGMSILVDALAADAIMSGVPVYWLCKSYAFVYLAVLPTGAVDLYNCQIEPIVVAYEEIVTGITYSYVYLSLR